MKYLVSIERHALDSHPQHHRLTIMGEEVILNREYRPNSIYIGQGDDGRQYFISDSQEIAGVMDHLFEGVTVPATLEVKRANAENLPHNLRRAYTELFESIGCEVPKSA